MAKQILKQIAKAIAITVIVVITASIVWTFVVPMLPLSQVSDIVEENVKEPLEKLVSQTPLAPDEQVTNGTPKNNDAPSSYDDIDDPPSDIVTSYDPPDMDFLNSGTVTKVIDGDTIDIDNMRFRLALIDTPERGEAGYNEARMFLLKNCPVQSLALYDIDDKQKTDKYGRYIGKVWCYGYPPVVPENSMNSKLVNEGHAVVVSTFCRSSEYGNEQWLDPHC